MSTRTVASPDAPTAADIADAVDRIAPSLAARAPAVEAARTLTPDVVEDLRDAGCFRLLLPSSHGGAGAELSTAIDMLTTLGQADGSVAWTTMIGCGLWCDLAELPRHSFDEIFDGGDAIPAGAFAPGGSIDPVDDGYEVTGRWGFASGIRHATVVYGNAVLPGPGDAPTLRAAVFDPADVEIEDTWRVAGLQGTGSEHFHVNRVVVPADRTFVPLGGNPCIDAPLLRMSTPSLIGILIAAVATGIAAGAIEDVTDLAESKVPMLAGSPLVTQPRFQHDLAIAHTELRAARALLDDTVGTAWEDAVAGRPPSLQQRAEQRAAGTWVATCSASVTDTAFRLAGSTAIASDRPLQRRWRDIHALTQHFIVQDSTFTSAGSAMATGDPGTPIF